MKASSWIAPIVLVLFSSSLAGLWWLTQPDPHPAPGPGDGLAIPPSPVLVAPVRQAPARESLEAIGSLRANESVVLRPELAGRIAGLHFDEGRAVAQGATLVTLDASEHKAELAQREAAVTLWTLKAKRARDLLGKRVMSAQESDEIEAALKEARAGMAVARARLEKTTLRAPFHGLLGLRRVSPGDYVEAGQDLVNLEDIDPIKVDLALPERYAGRLQSDQDISITVDAYPNETFRGSVYAVNPRLDAATRSLALRATIDNPGGRLRPGMFVRARVEVAVKDDALWVPEQALVPLGKTQNVYRIESGKARLTEVAIGLRVPGEVEITRGLKAEDVVVTEGQTRLRDGAVVRVMDGAAAPKT
ncbi:MAG: efflux RND transporter periplasmic adaptor subunit [Gammaproteobacteria bacterium]